MTNIANPCTDTQANIRPSCQQVRAHIEELLGANLDETAPPNELAALIDKAAESTQHRLKLANTLIRNFSIIPVKSDGSKSPATLGGKWKPYQSKKAREAELINWYPDGSSNGLAIIGGGISENRLIIDFEDIDIFYAWLSKAVGAGNADILKQCAMVRTPRISPNPAGGMHLYLQLICEPPGGTKLAWSRVPGEEEKYETLIETKASGGY